MLGFYVLILLSSFMVSLFFMPIFRKLSLKYNLFVSKGIPLAGGPGMGLTFILVSITALILYQGLPKEIFGIIIASVFMLVFGIIDDWRELSILAKFLMQIIAAGLLILLGVRTQIMHLGNILNIIITLIWVLGVTNAFNHLDIIDGVAAGSSVIIAFSFFVICILNSDTQTAILSLALSGAALGFFLHNFPPAKIYMGNSGSHFLGFVLSAIALTISYAPLERKAAIFSPLLILGLPIFDTAFLSVARMLKNTSPFKKSNDHLALRLLALGYTKKQAVFILLSLCLFFCVCGIIVSQAPNLWGMLSFVSVILLSLGIAVKIGRIPVHG